MTEDLFDRIEAAGQADRAAAKAEQKSPTQLAKRNSGRRQRNIGVRTEREVAKALAPCGFVRVPMSGSMGGDYRGDVARGRRERNVFIPRREGRAVERLEVKHDEGGQIVIRRWLNQGGGMDAVVIDTGGADDQLVVMALPTLVRLLCEAGYAVA